MQIKQNSWWVARYWKVAFQHTRYDFIHTHRHHFLHLCNYLIVENNNVKGACFKNVVFTTHLKIMAHAWLHVKSLLLKNKTGQQLRLIIIQLYFFMIIYFPVQHFKLTHLIQKKNNESIYSTSLPTIRAFNLSQRQEKGEISWHSGKNKMKLYSQVSISITQIYFSLYRTVIQTSFFQSS